MVVCEAKQIIYAYIDNAYRKVVLQIIDAIESPDIGRFSAEVVGGTWSAFNGLDAKFLFQWCYSADVRL